MLEGIRIVDFSNYIPGPYASMRLADLGAEVIKVEPLTGDPGRFVGETPKEKGAIFEANNRNKKSITLNLKDSNGLQIALDLITKSDVVIESFRPGVMKRLGLGYEAVKVHNPRIIYCSLSGYGQSGVLSQMGSHDINYMALSGVLSQLKDYNGRPIHPTITIADLIGGMSASESILAALVQKERSNKGAYIDAALLDSMISIVGTHVALHNHSNQKNGVSLISGKIISYYIYETKDNRFISLGALEPKFWKNFCCAVNHEEWIDFHLAKPDDADSIFNELQLLFKERTLKEWTMFSMEVDCCMAPILEIDELREFPYIKERKLIEKVNEQFIQVASRFNMLKSLSDSVPPPTMGEHTEFILENLLARSKEDISKYRELGVI